MTVRFLEGNQIQPAWAGLCVDMDTNQTGDYICVKNYRRVMFLFGSGVGTAGDDPTLTLYEAKTNAGGSAQVLANIATHWIKQAATSLAGTGTFTKTTQSAASTIAFNATSAEQVVLDAFEVDTEDLSAGFDYLRVDVALGASGGAQYGFGLYFLLDPRYPQPTSLEAIA